MPYSFNNGQIHDVPIYLNQLYNYIELDPTMTPADAAGYQGPVTQSNLYTNPNFVVRISL